MKQSVVRAALVVVAATGLTVTTVAPAAAGSLTIKEKGDEDNALDIWKFEAHYKKKALKTSVKMRNIRRHRDQQFFLTIDPPRGLNVYLTRIDLGEKKPRVRFYRFKRPDAQHPQIIGCKIRLSVRYKADRIAFSTPSRCLKAPKKVRVLLITARKGHRDTLDEAPDNTQWSRWIKRG